MHPLILAALIGGTTGGLSAASRGTDPMKGILSGAVTGAATSGLGSLLGPAATSGATTATAEEIAKQKLIEEGQRNAAMRAMSAGSKEVAAGMTKELAAGQAGELATQNMLKYGTKTAPSSLAEASAAADAMKAKNLAAQNMAKYGTETVPKYPNFQKAMDPFDLHKNEYVGRMGYATTPSAAWAGELAFNKPEEKKKKGPPMNMLYGRNPGRFGFGEWFDEDKVKEIYEDKDNPYYYPEYAEGGEVSPMVGAAGTAQAVAEYLQANGVEPTMENVQDVIEKIIAPIMAPIPPSW